jgi:hypothetical protein
MQLNRHQSAGISVWVGALRSLETFFQRARAALRADRARCSGVILPPSPPSRHSEPRFITLMKRLKFDTSQRATGVIASEWRPVHGGL